MTRIFTTEIRRRTLLAGVGSAAALAMTGARAFAQDAPTGELVILNWLGGSELDMMHAIQKAFMAKYPGVTIREVSITGQGDMRGGMRTALMGGEVVDLMMNTWPAFRKELIDAGMLRPIDDQWTSYGWDKPLGKSWRDLGSVGGTTYGLTYTYGDRSGIWFKREHLTKAGITETPKTWAEFLGTFEKLTKAGYSAPVAIPGKFWAHAEWFENLLLRTGGVEAAAKLAAHEIPWTDPVVKAALSKYAEMLTSGCCGAPNSMLANDWDGEADQVFQANTKNYLLIGMWMNNRAKNDYKLEEGKDYSLFQFPSLGMGHDDTASVDAKEFLVTANGANPKAADAFLDFWTSAEAANLLAKAGYASPSSNTDTSLYGEVQKTATSAVATSKVQFVLGDLLPGDLVDEYRVQLQKFLQDPSDANIDTVLAAIEEKAKGVLLMTQTSASLTRESAGKFQSPKPAASRESRRRPLGETPAALILIAPVIVLFAISVIYPLAETIRLSFWDIQGLKKPAFVGLGNYIKLMSDAAFRHTLLTTLIFTIGTTVLSVGIGWFLAMLCAFAPKQTLIFRVMIFAAFGISEAVSGYMWIGIYRPDAGGLLNSMIQSIGFTGFSHAWLGDPNTALWALIVAVAWSGVGLPLMLIFAAIQAIPKSVLEAAYMDGARPFSTMRHIMMPLSMPGVRVAVFINLLTALRAFDIIFILTGGGPVRSTETVGYFMYRESMTQFKLGYGAAATVVLLLAVLVISTPAIIQRTAGAK